MSKVEDNSIDMILCDLPYGTTQNKWDSIIPFDKLWEQYERVILEPSHVLQAIGCPKEYINGTLRFGFSLENTVDEIKYVVDKIDEVIKMIGV